MHLLRPPGFGCKPSSHSQVLAFQAVCRTMGYAARSKGRRLRILENPAHATISQVCSGLRLSCSPQARRSDKSMARAHSISSHCPAPFIISSRREAICVHGQGFPDSALRSAIRSHAITSLADRPKSSHCGLWNFPNLLVKCRSADASKAPRYADSRDTSAIRNYCSATPLQEASFSCLAAC